MQDEFKSLRDKLHAEFAQVDWKEIERFFSRGMLINVSKELDLLAVAEAMANDDRKSVQFWIDSGGVARMTDDIALDFARRQPALWAVVVAPWILVQERIIH
ncbi:MAG TPA: DUF2288 domain-containing protein [Halothiobacillus sp.]|mgnify:CR=1 FL=1|nr:DUF2288 domain-containing protein [Halothiobacillus sp.]